MQEVSLRLDIYLLSPSASPRSTNARVTTIVRHPTRASRGSSPVPGHVRPDDDRTRGVKRFDHVREQWALLRDLLALRQLRGGRRAEDDALSLPA
jgi:hypothetical protein